MEKEENVLRCESCGAHLMINSLVNAKCIYCGSVHFIKEKFNSDFIPDSIIQFQNSLSMAENSLKDFIKDLDEIPNDKYEVVSISPVYVPCTIYNFGVDLYQKIMRHSKSENSDSFLEQKSKMVYTIVQDGSINVNDDFIYSIEPFDYSKMQNFNPAYLTGAYTELSQDKMVLNKAIRKIEKAIFNKFYFTKGLVDCNLYTIDMVKAYLPVWFANVKYDNNIYNFIMNDTTNKWVTNIKRKDGKLKNTLTSAFLLMLPVLYLVAIFIMINKFHFEAKSSLLVTFFILVGLGALITVTSRTKNKKIRDSMVKKVEEYVITPIKEKLVSNKTISFNDVPNEKTIRFYLDGKQI